MKELFLGIGRAIAADPLARLGVGALVAMLVLAVFAPWLAPYRPTAVHYRGEGVALVHDGTAWQPPRVLVPESLLGVAGDGDALWAVGTGGAVVRLRGEEHETVDVPTDADLRAVGADGGRAMAVGDAGTVVAFDGETWRLVDSPGTVTLHGVALRGQQAVVVGEGGTAWAWDGAAWESLDTGTDADLYGVALDGSGQGYAVGEGGALLRFDGAGFEPIGGVGFRDLYAVDVLDEHAIAVGQRGTILRYDGETWNQMLSPESRDLDGVWHAGPETAWAVGSRGVVLRLADGAWVQEDVGYQRNLLAVDGVAQGSVAVGTDPVLDVLSPPSRSHLFGTTEHGQDVFSQVVWGSRTALLVGFLAAALVVLIGTNVGLVAGYFRGRVDDALMRVVDLMYALPFEPFALILVVVFRPSLAIVILAIGLLVWRTNARVIRSQVLSLANRPFVKAAKVSGASDWRILYVHIAPNVLPLVFLQLAIATAFAISAEATLSFLGLGPPDSFSWGTILFDARLSGAWRTAWWWTAPPGLFITLTILSVFFVVRALEVLANPRLRRAVDAP